MEQNHIIHKVVIDVSVNNKEKAYEIKDDISSFLTMDILPKLEKHLNTVQATLPAHTLQISQLALDFNHSESSLNSTLKDDIVASFKKELAAIIKAGTILDSDPKENVATSLLGEEERLLLTFIYFVENGHMPWWSSNEKAATIFEPVTFKKIIAAKAFVTKMADSMRKPKVRERIINQFTDTQITQICLAVIKAKDLKIALENPIIKQLSKQSFADRKAIWSLILTAMVLSSGNSDDDQQKQLIQQVAKTIPLLNAAKNENAEEQIWNEIIAVFPSIRQDDVLTIRDKAITISNKTSEKSKSNRENKPQKADKKKASIEALKTDLQEAKITDEVNGFHVQNAGLVLIHPFIFNLFKYCDLIDPETKTLTDPEICVHLLHYIATGKTNQPESGMLFEKFLCNVPLHQSINRHVKLSRKHKSEAAKVIGAVQQNWSSMKTASVGLLQYEFFQRPGKLILNNSQNLTIERKAQDILLDKLSWGISLIKLPWQDQFIQVSW